MKRAITLLTVLPGTAFAHGGHGEISEPLHALSHSGHIVGAIIIVAALLAFYREKDQS